MKANEMQRDDVARFVGSREGKRFLDGHDECWTEVMRQAEEHGFITFAYSGTAVLATHSNVMREGGVAEVAKRVQMCGMELPGYGNESAAAAR